MKKYLFLGVLQMNACSQKAQLPVAIKKPHEMTEHGHTRIDDYYWMRLTDEQKLKKPYDDHTQQVIDYINLENQYTEDHLSHTKKLLDDIFNEIVGRIEKDDETVPYFENGYYYYTRYEKEGRGKQIEAQKVWHSIYISQIEVGMPYILFKDACNK